MTVKTGNRKSSRKKSGTRKKQEPEKRRETVAEPRNPERHSHTVLIDFDTFAEKIAGLPDPDGGTITYTREAVDLLAAVSADSESFARAARGAPKGASWTEQLLYIPDELFGAAFKLLDDQNEGLFSYEDDGDQSSTSEMLAERIMRDHVMDFGFYDSVADFLRYAEPEPDERYAESLI